MLSKWNQQADVVSQRKFVRSLVMQAAEEVHTTPTVTMAIPGHPF